MLPDEVDAEPEVADMSVPPLYTFPSRFVNGNGSPGYIESPISFDMRYEFTICARVKIGGPNSGHNCFFSLEAPKLSPRSVIWLGVMWEGSPTARFFAADTTGKAADFAGATDLSKLQGEWIHIAFTFSSGNMAAIYINGVHDAHSQLSDPLKEVTDIHLCIGRALWNDTHCDYWNGEIENVKVWQRLLSPDQIAEQAKAPIY